MAEILRPETADQIRDAVQWALAGNAAYEVLGSSSVDEVIMSTPAISAGVMVVRGQRHVFGFGEPLETSRTTDGD